MKRKGVKNITYEKRRLLEQCLENRLFVKQISALLGISKVTVYRELKRGAYYKTVYMYTDVFGDKHYKDVLSYSADVAQQRYEDGKSAHGPQLKIGKHFEIVDFIESHIIDDKYSPGMCAGVMKVNNLFSITLSKTTIYRYIVMGIFPNIKMSDLQFGKRKKTYKHVKTAKRPPKGPSIETRPQFIDDRIEFGHWEMDTVIGKKSTKDVLLVLTERTTLNEIVIKLKNKKASSVVKALNELKTKYGKNFNKVFKSITVDNGVEFSYYKEMRKTIDIPIYYCHPYCASERGSNERVNRDIRRWLPKGTDFTSIPNEYIQLVESKVNNLPRETRGFATPAFLFEQQLKLLGID